jgi:hypothetical protein
VVSGFYREIDKNCALLGYYEAINGKFLPAFRDNQSVPSSGVKNPILLDTFWNPEYETDRLSRNVVKNLPLRAA